MITISQLTKEELVKFLSPLTDSAAQMIIAGVLKKNVIKHFTNKGIDFLAAENIVEIGCFKANELQKNKAK